MRRDPGTFHDAAKIILADRVIEVSRDAFRSLYYIITFISNVRNKLKHTSNIKKV